MQRLLMLVAIGVLLTVAAPRSSAALNYNSSKSNTGNFVIAYTDPVTRAQADAILADLEKAGRSPDETGVRGILSTHGVQSDSIGKIIIDKGPSGSKGATILLLKDPGDENAARSAANITTSRSNTQHN